MGHVFILKHLKGKTVVHEIKRILKKKYTIHRTKYFGSATKTTTVQTILFLKLNPWPSNATKNLINQPNYKKILGKLQLFLYSYVHNI